MAIRSGAIDQSVCAWWAASSGSSAAGFTATSSRIRRVMVASADAVVQLSMNRASGANESLTEPFGMRISWAPASSAACATEAR